MESILIVLTLVCLVLPLYVYMGYPVLLWLMVKCRRKSCPISPGPRPPVTLIISCYNEASIIGQKLDNALALDYPAELLNILVVSDGSDDATDDIVRQYPNERVRLIRQEGRLGKTAGLNLAMQQVESSIVVFSDANAMYATDAIDHLVKHFSNSSVGYVVGAALYTDAAAGASAQNENYYWQYELAIKKLESQVHSVVGGDGAIYAIRANLWEPLRNDDINDFVNPLQIVIKGFRGVFEPRAECYEETAGEFKREFERKERIVNRSIQALLRNRAALNPAKVGIFSFEVISHKLLRWILPAILLFLVMLSMLLSLMGYGFFKLIVGGALLITLLAFAGQLSQKRDQLPIPVSLAYYFVLVNVYAVRGIVKAVMGHTHITWNTPRMAQGARAPSSSQWVTGLYIAAVILMAATLFTGNAH